MTTGAPGITGLLACQRMTDNKYNAKSMKGMVSDNVLSDILAFSYPRIQGGPVVGYNNIDAGTKNVKCDTAVAKRQNDGDGDACSLSLASTSATPASTSTTTTQADETFATFTSASTSASTSTTTTQADIPLATFGTPGDQCPSEQLESCSCQCFEDEDCGPCTGTLYESFVPVCVSASGLGGCCQCI